MLERERVLRALAALSRNATAAQPASAAPAPAAVDAAGTAPLASILGGEWIDTEHGRAFVKDVKYPLAHAHGNVALGALLGADRDALRALLAHADPPPVHRLGFFDTETTGLAGGTGTYIFLAGLGWFEGGDFRLRQYFLPDLGHERAMLALLSSDMVRLDAIVSYNGRAFDAPLLAARCTLARLRGLPGNDWGLLPHFDLVRAGRRLYRGRLPSCSLVEVESRLLGMRRQDDVPGHIIPSLYFDYIRAGRAAPLRAVLRHNALDILSLAALLAAVADLFARAEGASPELDPLDALALGRWHESDGRLERARTLYRFTLSRLEQETGAEPWASAASRLARLLKRDGLRAESLPLWERLWRRGDLDAGIEMAKHLEHRTRDFQAAVELARQLLSRWPASDAAGRAGIEHRLARLARKQAALEGAPVPVEPSG